MPLAPPVGPLAPLPRRPPPAPHPLARSTMLRYAPTVGSAALALLTVPAALAQGRMPDAEVLPIQGAVRYGGTFHVDTGTWTRARGPVAAFGQPDNIYSNTASAAYFFGGVGPLGGSAFGTVVDDGVIPSIGDPTPFALGGPRRNASLVTEVQIGYCDTDSTPRVAGWQLDFYQAYSPCTYPPATPPTGSVQVVGAPSGGCWIIDLALGSSAFTMNHDGDGVHDAATGGNDSFGVAWRYTGQGTGAAGFFITGDYAATDTGFATLGMATGSNTYYGEIGSCPGFGTGYRNQDQYWIQNGGGASTIASGCYAFGGYTNVGTTCAGIPRRPFGGFWFELSGQAAAGGPCICSRGCVGTANSTGAPGVVTLSGSSILANDDMVLTASGLPPNQFGIFVVGAAPLPANSFVVANGYLCIAPMVGPGLGRINVVRSSGPTGQFSLSALSGAWSASALPGSAASYAAMAGTVTHFQAWHRDVVGLGSNLTGSAVAVWQ